MKKKTCEADSNTHKDVTNTSPVKQRKMSLIADLNRIETSLLNSSHDVGSIIENTHDLTAQAAPLRAVNDPSECTEAAIVPMLPHRAVSPSLTGISQVFIHTPRLKDNAGLMIPPQGWNENVDYAAGWDLEEFEIDEEVVLSHDYNLQVKDIKEVAWLISGINHVKLAVFQEKILELLFLTWKPCWVPLRLVIIDSDKLRSELKSRRDDYNKSPKRVKDNLKRDIPGHVARTLALYRLTNETKFLVKQINKYAIIHVPEFNSSAQVVKADFVPTYEHSSVLFRNEEVYKTLYMRRIEASSAFLKTNEDSHLMKEFLERSKDELEKINHFLSIC